MVFLEAFLYNKNILYIQNFHLGNFILAGEIMTFDSGSCDYCWIKHQMVPSIFFKQYLLAGCFALTCLGGTLMLT